MDDYEPTKLVATCYIECDGKILMLRRRNYKWCTPGGKLEQGETAFEAVMREIREETGILLNPDLVQFVKTVQLNVHYLKRIYVIHVFKTVLPVSQTSDCNVVLNHEHREYRWTDPMVARQMDLVPGGRSILELASGSSS